MNHTHTVRCCDCGSLALRSYITSTVKPACSCPQNQIISTECPSCDYLLITCAISGNVIDAHSSSASIIARKPKINYSPRPIARKTRPTMPWPKKNVGIQITRSLS